MKKLFKISLFSFFALLAVACTDGNDDANQDALTGSQNVGGLLDIDTASLTYPFGSVATATFPVNISVFQGEVKTTSVAIYKQFFGALGTSEKVLYKTVTFPATAQKEFLSYDVSYNELISGLTVAGAPLPATDAGLSVGDYWLMTYVATTSAGTTNLNVKKTKITAACVSNLVGTYKRGSKTSVVTSIGDAAYHATYMPAFASTYWFEFTDVCGVLQITDWEYQSSNPITATGLSTMPTGFVTSAGNLTFEHANVAGVSWYVDLNWTLIKQP